MFNISEIALTAATVCADASRIEAFHERIKRLLKEGLIDVAARESEHPRAARLLSKDEACLAALLAVTTELFDFGTDLQRAIVRAVRESGPSLNPLPGPQPVGGLARAVFGIANDERWVLALSWRGHKEVQARFLPYGEAYLSEVAEEMLESAGAPLLGKLILPLNSLFEPFACSGRR
jgi:hypothetical protein